MKTIIIAVVLVFSCSMAWGEERGYCSNGHCLDNDKILYHFCSDHYKEIYEKAYEARNRTLSISNKIALDREKRLRLLQKEIELLKTRVAELEGK